MALTSVGTVTVMVIMMLMVGRRWWMVVRRRWMMRRWRWMMMSRRWWMVTRRRRMVSRWWWVMRRWWVMMTKSWRMVWRMESRWGNIIGGCCKTCLRLLVQQVIWGQGHVRWWWADLTDWRNLITFFFIRLLLTCFNSILICGCVHFFGD